ncbi:MAG TPA: DUF2516 family protein [Candidatus Yaniella excrementigallinarum]|nr:DUF2516 family protein [Candidatus Yaniella excrementigallinarum]
MDFLHIVVMIEYGLQAGLALVGAGMVIWAMADAARRPTTAFENHTNQTKATWLLILGGALIFGLGSAALTVFYGGQMGLFGLASIIAAGVYLAGPKRQFEIWT